MYTILAFVHVAVSVVLIAIVLMQSQQSMNLSGMFGGASQSALGSQPQSVLSKLTTVLAIVFMALSLLFSVIPRSDDSILSPSEIPAGQQRTPAQSGQGQSAPDQESQSSPAEAPTGTQQ
jgi:preprotein translocase subunit SecG